MNEYSIEKLKDFLSINGILINDIDSILEKCVFLDIPVNDENMFLFGIFDDKIVVPKINDLASILVVIHEFIHMQLLLIKDDINDDEIVYSEVLPIFYEHIYLLINNISNYKIHTLEDVQFLLDIYNGEDIYTQIDKLKYSRKR